MILPGETGCRHRWSEIHPRLSDCAPGKSGKKPMPKTNAPPVFANRRSCIGNPLETGDCSFSRNSIQIPDLPTHFADDESLFRKRLKKTVILSFQKQGSYGPSQAF